MTGRLRLGAVAAGSIVGLLALAVLAADQTTKYLAVANLPPAEGVPVIGDGLVFFLVRNPGAAFSLGTGVTWLFTIVLAAVAVVIVVLTARSVRSRWWAVVLGLLLGGVLGNLTDRLLREPGFAVGHVVDFISTPWLLPAVYNVADTFIVTTMISVALLVIVGVNMDGSREKRGRRHDGDGEGILGVAGDEVPPGEGVSGFGSEFPVADPDAGIPRSERGLPPLTESEQQEVEREADREADREAEARDGRPAR